jgi:hypothetical protein
VSGVVYTGTLALPGMSGLPVVDTGVYPILHIDDWKPRRDRR